MVTDDAMLCAALTTKAGVLNTGTSTYYSDCLFQLLLFTAKHKYTHNSLKFQHLDDQWVLEMHDYDVATEI